MRIDHIALRVSSRLKTAKFFTDALGYKIQKEFPIPFDDGTQAQCIALEPPEKITKDPDWTNNYGCQIYHLPAEIFVSDGTPGSVVYEWVQIHGSGIHHIAYQVEDVEKVMNEWIEKGYAEFSSEKPLSCKNLTQVFTKPSELTGVIFEFIKRGEHGFCEENVHNLMLSTAKFK
jgi:catechol 2,3-dioxygenase-like lactoylglutathione lyase family enzyme